MTISSNKNHLWLLVIAYFALATTCLSQNLKLTIAKDSITFNENAVLTLTGELRDFNNYATLPEVDGLVVTHRTASYTLNHSNGRIKVTQTFTMQPIRPGDFEIGPAYIESGTKRIYSNSVDLNVEQTTASGNNNIVFLRCEPNKKKVYIGEMITLTLRLYHRADINFSGDRPYAHSFSGFWYQEGSIDGMYEDTVITVNGLKYVGETLYKEYVFPNSTGELYLPKYEYACYINFYGADANSLSIDQQVQLVSAPVNITALPLPDHDTLTGYNGDVGSFSISSMLETETTKAWEPIQLTITISGQGNFPFMMAPELHLPDGLKAQLSQSNDSVISLFNHYEGQKKFIYLITPEKEGNYDLSGFTYTYFDPYKDQYVTLTTPGYSLHVDPGEKLEADTESNLPDSFLVAKSHKTTILLISFVGLFAAGAIAIYIAAEKKKKKLSNAAIATVSNKEPESEFSAPADSSIEKSQAFLNSATLFLQNGQCVQTVNALYDALNIRICGITKMRREEISANTLKYKLALARISPDTISETLELYEELKLKRYTMSPSEIDVARILLQRTALLLAKLG